MPIDQDPSGSSAVATAGTRPTRSRRAVRGGLALSIIVGLLRAIPAGAQTAPADLDFSIAPTEIDTSVGPAMVAVGFTFEAGTPCLDSCDDLASATQVRLVQRASGQVLDGGFVPVIGSPTPRFEAVVVFPPSSAGGVWELEELLIAEAGGQRSAYDKAALDAVGAPTEILDTSTVGDETPPELLALGVDPSTVDTSLGEQTVTATASISDAQNDPCLDRCADSGSPSLLRFGHAASGQVRDALFQPAGGDQLAGAALFETPTAAGTWQVTGVVLADAAGSRQHYDAARLASTNLDASFDNQNPSGDEDAPDVDGAATDPAIIDTRAGDLMVTVTAALRDAGAGVCVADSGCDDGGSPTQVRFVNPTSGQVRHASLARVSGTPLDGVYQGQILLPQSSAGEFDLVTLLAADVQGNRRIVQVPEPAAGGVFAVLAVALLRTRRTRRGRSPA